MEITEDQFKIIWRAISWWMRKNTTVPLNHRGILSIVMLLSGYLWNPEALDAVKQDTFFL